MPVRSAQLALHVQGLAHTAPLDSKVDDLLDLDDADLKKMLSPNTLEEVSPSSHLYSVQLDQ